MAGIDISEEMTTAQLEAMAGGELLKAEGGYFSQVRNTKKSSQRLREALVDTDLSLPLCLLMAQQRDCIVYKEASNRHLKLVCNLLDHCMDTFVQFGLFLSTHLSVDEYSKWVPSLTVLGQEYHIPPDAVFFMLRPLVSNSVTVKFLEGEKSSKTEGVDKKTRASQMEANFCSASQEVMEPLIEASKLLFPPRIWEDISPRLFTTFWSLSLYDLYVPNGRYEEEIVKAKASIQSVEDNADLQNSSKRKKEQDRGQTLIEKLQEEKQRQEDNCRLVLARLRQDKESWFSPKVTKNRTITQFLQLCIFPRCRFTAIDALYCAKFVLMLHTLHVSNFSTLLFFDRIFSDISYTVACCTENEVRRYGRFLGQLLEITTRWHSSEAIYLQECLQTPGFISMMKTSANEKQYLDYENFRHITFKWHFKLTKSLVVCLESKDYMQIRNGLIVLTRILPYYPKVYHLSLALEKRVEKIMEEEKEKRADLYTLATGYAGMLKTHRVHLVAEAEFHNRDERVKAQNLESESKSFKGQDDGTLDFKEEKLSVTSKARLSDSPRSTDDGGRSSSKSNSAPSKEKDKDREKEKEKTKLVKSEGKEPPVKKEKKDLDTKMPSKENVQASNGSEQSSPPGGKAGQRRQHSSESSSTPESIAERDLKRRKTEDNSKSKLAETAKDKSVSDGLEPQGKEKVVRHERKRDRSADQDEQRGAEKDSVATKRRKESPEPVPLSQLPLPPTLSDELVTKERKLKVMVAKKDIHNVKLPPSPRLPKTVVKKEDDDNKTMKKEENAKDDERSSKKDEEKIAKKN
ncbi:hypothetical protein EMCRGX_G034079 [Ephydatia muelleri]